MAALASHASAGAMVFGLQAVPVLNFFPGLASAEYWPGVLVYAAAVGIGAEVLQSAQQID